jgi:TPR repeat protein
MSLGSVKMERRKTPRISIDKLAYVNFEPYNTGGVIIDVSTSGIRFHTVVPLEQGGILRLSMVFAGMNHLEAIGEVVWIDSTRKIGGLRFVVLPPAAADQIKNWLANSAGANRSQASAKSDPVPKLAARSTDEASVCGARIANAVSPHMLVLPGKSSSVLSLKYSSAEPRRRSLLTSALVTIVIVCLTMAPVAWFALKHPYWLSSWVPHAEPAISNPVAPETTLAGGILPGMDVSSAGATVLGKTNLGDVRSLSAANPEHSTEQPQLGLPYLQAANPTSDPATESSQRVPIETSPARNSESVNFDIQTAPAASSAEVLAPAPRNSVLPGSRHVDPLRAAQDSQANDLGESELILAWQYLEGQGGRPRDPTAASRLLWNAVKKGNLTAETTLANLYVRGEGVPKNCDQARVLLSAAFAKGNIEAKRKLQELNRTGCR